MLSSIPFFFHFPFSFSLKLKIENWYCLFHGAGRFHVFRSCGVISLTLQNNCLSKTDFGNMMNFRYSKVNFFLRYSGESNRFKWLMFKGLRVKVTAWLAWIKQLWLVHFDAMFPPLLGGNLLRGVLREKFVRALVLLKS